MALFAPMPRARVRTAINVNTGDLTSIRRAYLQSVIIKFQIPKTKPQGISKLQTPTRRSRPLVIGKLVLPWNLGFGAWDFSFRAHALADDELEHVTSLRSERHADSDFAGALLDAVCDRAVNSNGREEERDPGEYAQQQHHQLRLAEHLREDLAEWLRPD